MKILRTQIPKNIGFIERKEGEKVIETLMGQRIVRILNKKKKDEVLLDPAPI